MYLSLTYSQSICATNENKNIRDPHLHMFSCLKVYVNFADPHIYIFIVCLETQHEL